MSVFEKMSDALNGWSSPEKAEDAAKVLIEDMRVFAKDARLVGFVSKYQIDRFLDTYAKDRKI